MDLSWSQTPNSVWWALEQSGSTASLLGDSPASPTFSPNWKLGSVNNFYDYADEHDLGESEEEIMEWVKEHSSRGVIRYISVSAHIYYMHICNQGLAVKTSLCLSLLTSKHDMNIS